MDSKLELFLKSVEGYLKNMPISERIDVIKELKSSIEELQLKDALSADEILRRLGSPKELAAGYLGNKISTGNSFSFKKIMMIVSFYSLTSLTGMFVIPCGTVLGGGLMFCGILAPILGLVKFIGYLVGYNIPYIVMFQLGGYELPPLLAFPCSIIFGVLLFLIGRITWKSVIKYIRKISIAKRALDSKIV